MIKLPLKYFEESISNKIDVSLVLENVSNQDLPISAAFGYFSRSKEKIDKLVEKALKNNEYESFIKKYAVALKHNSLLEHPSLHFCVDGVSNIATKILESLDLVAYMERSTRYVDFGEKEDIWKDYEQFFLSGLRDLDEKFKYTVNSQIRFYNKKVEDYKTIVRKMYDHRSIYAEKDGIVEKIVIDENDDNIKILILDYNDGIKKYEFLVNECEVLVSEGDKFKKGDLLIKWKKIEAKEKKIYDSARYHLCDGTKTILGISMNFRRAKDMIIKLISYQNICIEVCVIGLKMLDICCEKWGYIFNKEEILRQADIIYQTVHIPYYSKKYNDNNVSNIIRKLSCKLNEIEEVKVTDLEKYNRLKHDLINNIFKFEYNINNKVNIRKFDKNDSEKIRKRLEEYRMWASKNDLIKSVFPKIDDDFLTYGFDDLNLQKIFIDIESDYGAYRDIQRHRRIKFNTDIFPFYFESFFKAIDDYLENSQDIVLGDKKDTRFTIYLDNIESYSIFIKELNENQTTENETFKDSYQEHYSNYLYDLLLLLNHSFYKINDLSHRIYNLGELLEVRENEFLKYHSMVMIMAYACTFNFNKKYTISGTFNELLHVSQERIQPAGHKSYRNIAYRIYRELETFINGYDMDKLGYYKNPSYKTDDLLFNEYSKSEIDEIFISDLNICEKISKETKELRIANKIVNSALMNEKIINY